MKVLDEFKDEIEQIAAEHQVDPDLVRAIVMTESAGDLWAMRFEPDFHDRYIVGNRDYMKASATERMAAATSWGLMQVMGAVARERGFAGKYLSELCEPIVGLRYGVKHLKHFLDRYVDSIQATAAYNAGSARRDADGRFVNQDYVDKVRQWYAKIKT